MAHTLPSASSITTFTAHFKRATFGRDGTCDVIFTLGRDMKNEIIELADNDGLALNVEVWATKLEGEVEGLGDLAEFARALGMKPDATRPDPPDPPGRPDPPDLSAFAPASDTHP